MIVVDASNPDYRDRDSNPTALASRITHADHQQLYLQHFTVVVCER